MSITFSLSLPQLLFAYLSQEKYEENGWSVYKPMEEFRRQVSLIIVLLNVSLHCYDKSYRFYVSIGPDPMSQLLTQSLTCN